MDIPILKITFGIRAGRNFSSIKFFWPVNFCLYQYRLLIVAFNHIKETITPIIVVAMKLQLNFNVLDGYFLFVMNFGLRCHDDLDNAYLFDLHYRLFNFIHVISRNNTDVLGFMSCS